MLRACAPHLPSSSSMTSERGVAFLRIVDVSCDTGRRGETLGGTSEGDSRPGAVQRCARAHGPSGGRRASSSTRKVERPAMMASLAPTLVKMRSTGVSEQLSAATQQPSCAINTVMHACARRGGSRTGAHKPPPLRLVHVTPRGRTCRSTVDLPPMFGPVTSRKRGLPGSVGWPITMSLGMHCVSVSDACRAGRGWRARPVGACGDEGKAWRAHGHDRRTCTHTLTPCLTCRNGCPSINVGRHMPLADETIARDRRQSSSAAHSTAHRHSMYFSENWANRCSSTSVRISSVQKRRQLQPGRWTGTGWGRGRWGARRTVSNDNCSAVRIRASGSKAAARTILWTTSGRSPRARPFSGASPAQQAAGAAEMRNDRSGRRAERCASEKQRGRLARAHRRDGELERLGRRARGRPKSDGRVAESLTPSAELGCEAIFYFLCHCDCLIVRGILPRLGLHTTQLARLLPVESRPTRWMKQAACRHSRGPQALRATAVRLLHAHRNSSITSPIGGKRPSPAPVHVSSAPRRGEPSASRSTSGCKVFTTTSSAAIPCVAALLACSTEKECTRASSRSRSGSLASAAPSTSRTSGAARSAATASCRSQISSSRAEGAQIHFRSSRLPKAVAVRSSTAKSVPLSEPSSELEKTSRFWSVLPSTTSVGASSSTPSSDARHVENWAWGSSCRSSSSRCKYLRQPPKAAKAAGGARLAASRSTVGQPSSLPPACPK
eukprot:scaffold133193_cov26-Tisochrysis_lutea.AAC.3